MSTTYQYNCDNNAEAPTIGMHIAITTINSILAYRNSQKSTASGEKITIPNAAINIHNCYAQFDIVMEYDFVVNAFGPMLGKYGSPTGVNGDWMITSFDGGIWLFISGGISIGFESPEITAAFNDGKFHTILLKTDNTAPVSGANHITLEFDGVPVPALTEITSGWTATSNSNDVYILDISYGTATYHAPHHIDNILLTDGGPPTPVVTVEILEPTEEATHSTDLNSTPISGRATIIPGSITSISCTNQRTGETVACTVTEV